MVDGLVVWFVSVLAGWMINPLKLYSTIVERSSGELDFLKLMHVIGPIHGFFGFDVDKLCCYLYMRDIQIVSN